MMNASEPTNEPQPWFEKMYARSVPRRRTFARSVATDADMG